MKDRLVYEVRLKKTSKKKTPWRWDVTYFTTYDPLGTGSEGGRCHQSGEWGYTRFKFQALSNIGKHMLSNPFKGKFEEV